MRGKPGAAKNAAPLKIKIIDHKTSPKPDDAKKANEEAGAKWTEAKGDDIKPKPGHGHEEGGEKGSGRDGDMGNEVTQMVVPSSELPQPSPIWPQKQKTLTEPKNKPSKQQLVRQTGSATENEEEPEIKLFLSLVSSTRKLSQMVDKNTAKWQDEKGSCRYWYGGIGITIASEHSVSEVEVSEVFAGYAADIAGIRKGDILSVEEGTLRGVPGTSIDIEVARKVANSGGEREVFYVSLKREKICLRRPSPYGNSSDVLTPSYLDSSGE